MVTVEQLWRYPVKSMQGERVDRLELGPEYVLGDRQWAVHDPAAGKVLSAKRWPPLLLASARSEGDGVIITLPDGTDPEAGAAAADEALSAWLDHPVTLRRPADSGTVPFEMYADPADDGSEVFEWAGPPGYFGVLAAAHLLTTASLRAAEALYPDGSWDVRRFRPTALLAADGDDFVEDAWVGGQVRLGGAQVAPFMPTVRCSMPTREQPGLPRDADIARILRSDHGQNLGVYCSVTTPGTVAEGDAVEVITA